VTVHELPQRKQPQPPPHTVWSDVVIAAVMIVAALAGLLVVCNMLLWGVIGLIAALGQLS